MSETDTNPESPQKPSSASSSTPCSASLADRVERRKEYLHRELTTEETIPLIAAEIYAHRNWHNLGGSEQLLVARLEQAGYLAPSGQGFTGRASLPNDQVKTCRGATNPNDSEHG